MNIKRAKQEIKNTIQVYLTKNAHGEYEIPSMRQRPVLLIGPPGIGKTQIMEQVARECGIGLVSYTITHHTRQSAIGLPFISEKTYSGKNVHIASPTLLISPLVHSVPAYRQVLFLRSFMSVFRISPFCTLSPLLPKIYIFRSF